MGEHSKDNVGDRGAEASDGVSISGRKPSYDELEDEVRRLRLRAETHAATLWALEGAVSIPAEAETGVASQEDGKALWGGILAMPMFACRLDAQGFVHGPWGRALDRLGLSPSDMAGQEMGRVFPELADAIADALAGGSSVASYDGEFRGIRWRALVYLSHDADSGGASLVGLDVVEYWGLRAQLQASQRRYTTLAESAPVGIVRTDAQGSCVYANQTLCHVAGLPMEDLLGQGWLRLIPEVDRETVVSHLSSTIESGKPGRGTWRVLDGRGNVIWVSVNSVPERDHHGTVLGYLATLTDVTARKETENEIQALNDQLNKRLRMRTAQLEAANRELEAFCYSVSHDLRAPLRSIDGFCKMLLDEFGDQLDDVGQGYLERARLAGQRMGALIDDLLHLSRVGRTALAETLLANLLSNAVKFSSKEAAPLIQIGTVRREDGRDAFYVRDNGAGFDMAFSRKLFAPFERLHSPEEFEGHGVGLATVARIVARHQGWIEAEGSVGRGAIFYFTLEKEAPPDMSLVPEPRS